MESRVVGTEEFLEWAAPYVAAIQALTTAIDCTRDRHGALPTPDSKAMAEVAEEQGYRSRSEWNQPLTDTHMLGARTLQAATDYVRGLADLFEHGRPPLYAHLTLARAALEASVVSAWLNEPQISTLDRIKRGLCEFLYSAREVAELGLSPDATEKVVLWNRVAQSFGWEVEGVRGRPKIGGVRRPRIGTEISRLGGGTGSSQVGDLLYSRLSAVDHVTWFGLISAFDIGAAVRDERTGTATVPIGVDGERFASYVYYVVAVLRAAAEMRFATFGWADADWGSAMAAAGELEGALLRAGLDSAPSPR